MFPSIALVDENSTSFLKFFYKRSINPVLKKFGCMSFTKTFLECLCRCGNKRQRGKKLTITNSNFIMLGSHYAVHRLKSLIAVYLPCLDCRDIVRQISSQFFVPTIALMPTRANTCA